MIKFFVVSLTLITGLALSSLNAEEVNWPTFRGPNGTDISPDKGLLKEWPADGPKQLWVFKNAGMGYSGFSLAGDKLYTMGTIDETLHMICVNIADGSQAWSKPFGTDDKSGYNASWGHGPRGTPTLSDGKLYGLGPKGVLVCMNAATGEKLWSKHLRDDFGGKPGGWGFSESPFVDGNKVVVAPGGKEAGIVALDKNTGELIWEANAVKPGKAEYASIIPTTQGGKLQYVKFFEKTIASVSAEDGSLLWEASFPNGRTAVIPTPIIEGSQLYVAAGYGAGCVAFEIGSDTTLKELWKNNVMKNHHGGVIKLGDHLYGFSDGPGLVCQDWKTGEEVWHHRDRQHLSKGAVHIADGMIYAVNEQNGAVTLAKASPEGFQQKGRFILEPQSPNRSPKGKVWTHPVVIGGKLYLRDQEYLHCYDVKG